MGSFGKEWCRFRARFKNPAHRAGMTPISNGTSETGAGKRINEKKLPATAFDDVLITEEGDPAWTNGLRNDLSQSKTARSLVSGEEYFGNEPDTWRHTRPRMLKILNALPGAKVGYYTADTLILKLDCCTLSETGILKLIRALHYAAPDEMKFRNDFIRFWWD